MSRLSLILLSSVFVMPTPAYALLSVNAEVGLEAAARVDLDTFGPNPPVSTGVQNELVKPFLRSLVTVADAQTAINGASFDYFGSADIGTLALKVSGSLTNLTASDFVDQGVSRLQVTTEILDVITLTINSAVPVPITLNMRANGMLNVAGGSASANAGVNLNVVGTSTTNGDFGRFTGGPLDDPNTPEDEGFFSITKMVAGPTVDLEVYALLFLNIGGVNAGQTVSGELANSAFLELVLPAGVELANSQSGTFLEVIPAPVPLPAGLGLMLPALVGLWAQRRLN